LVLMVATPMLYSSVMPLSRLPDDEVYR